MLAEQRVAQTKWLKGTLTLCYDKFRERSDVTGEPCGSPCGRQGTAKFEFKLPSVHSVVCGRPTTKSEFRQAEIRQWLVLGYPNLAPYLDTARECYEAYVIYNFMMFLLNFLDDEMDLDATMESKPQTSHFFPLCCLKPWRMGSQGVAIMFLMKAQFMHDIFGINSGDPDVDEDKEREDSSIIQKFHSQ
ncbi:Transmembrane protein 184C [Portunus trituberculatus]|uniref:Transmembrane protein 184C n=1 Tax=Portunus trituberculatus TaxID=210409 RepID=A0A5B7DET8_PORTR|nr:Transmembrane protein 184C [Portunus trituberculatus]